MNPAEFEEKNRRYLPLTIDFDQWEEIAPFYTELMERPISDVASLRRWLADRSELESALAEDMAWRYIKMTCDTANKDHQKKYNHFIQEIEPKTAPYNDLLNRKALDNPFFEQIQAPGYAVLKRNMEKDILVYREKNIPLKTKIQELSKEYGNISGAMTVMLDGVELTLQQAAVRLESADKDVRKEAYEKIAARRLEDSERLSQLFDELVSLRH
jgi:oligoendopeptidase F